MSSSFEVTHFESLKLFARFVSLCNRLAETVNFEVCSSDDQVLALRLVNTGRSAHLLITLCRSLFTSIQDPSSITSEAIVVPLKPLSQFLKPLLSQSGEPPAGLRLTLPSADATDPFLTLSLSSPARGLTESVAIACSALAPHPVAVNPYVSDAKPLWSIEAPARLIETSIVAIGARAALMSFELSASALRLATLVPPTPAATPVRAAAVTLPPTRFYRFTPHGEDGVDGAVVSRESARVVDPRLLRTAVGALEVVLMVCGREAEPLFLFSEWGGGDATDGGDTQPRLATFELLCASRPLAEVVGESRDGAAEGEPEEATHSFRPRSPAKASGPQGGDDDVAAATEDGGHVDGASAVGSTLTSFLPRGV